MRSSLRNRHSLKTQKEFQEEYARAVLCMRSTHAFYLDLNVTETVLMYFLPLRISSLRVFSVLSLQKRQWNHPLQCSDLGWSLRQSHPPHHAPPDWTQLNRLERTKSQHLERQLTNSHKIQIRFIMIPNLAQSS